MSLNIVVFIEPEHDFLAEFKQLLTRLAELTLKETGCEVFDVFSHENKCVLIERWHSQHSIDQHMAEPWTQEFIKKTKNRIVSTDVYRLQNI